MRQVQPTEDFSVCNIRAYNFVPGNLRVLLELTDDAPDPLVHIASGTLNHIQLARAIAKIAYCNVVARNGLGGFRPLVLPDLILGRYPYVPYFVGTDPREPPPPSAKNLRHAVQIATANGREGLSFRSPRYGCSRIAAPVNTECRSIMSFPVRPLRRDQSSRDKPD